MKSLLILVLLSSSVLILSCDEDTTRTGSYIYTALHSGSPVVVGTIHLDEVTVSRVSGRWELSRTGSSNVQVGPQIGNGTLEGSFDGGTLNIDMNPGVADNNVFLSGVFDGKTLRGEWNFSGLPGVISQGTFIAQQQ